MSKPAAPFLPLEGVTTRYSMAGDDCSLHFSLDQLTPKQQADHMSNQVLTGMLQVALLYIAQGEDEVCIYDTFNNTPWADALQRYHHMFKTLGLTPLDLKQVRYHPMQDFYSSVATAPSNCERETLYMTSHSNAPLHKNPAALRTSQNLNSKVHFAEFAPKYGLPVPNTLTCTKGSLHAPEVVEFFQVHPQLMLKTLGLAGARNVISITDIAEAEDYLTEYDSTMDVVLQEKLDTQHYTEMTVDLSVSDDSIHVTNVRKILFADGLWVGNLLGGQVAIDDDDLEVLIKIGEYARHHGYTHPQGLNLGIDYFVRNPDAPKDLQKILITEINARWTGGLFPAHLVQRLQAQENPKITEQNVVAFIDFCPPAAFDKYLEFVQQHLFVDANQEFGIAPMGFAPFPVEIEGEDILFVWQIVVGNFETFKHAKLQCLESNVLPTVPKITTGL